MTKIVYASLTDLHMGSSRVLFYCSLFYSQTGAIDRSHNIMMQIDHTRLREREKLYTRETVVRHNYLTDCLNCYLAKQIMFSVFPCHFVTNLPLVQIQSQLLHLTDALPDNLPALLKLPLTPEQSHTVSTQTTTEEGEGDTDKISDLDEDLQRYHLTQIPS